MSKKKTTVYQIPAEKMPGSKLHSGEEFNQRMVGALYGSSFEYNISIRLQYANGKNVQCPADPALTKILKPKYQHGEFGAEIAQECQEFPASKREIGRCVCELASIEDIRAVRESYNRLMHLGELTNQLNYTDVEGKRLNYLTLRLLADEMKAHNQEVQAAKDKLIADAGCSTQYVGGRKVSPEYPRYLLEELQKLNQEVWTATGVNLIITFTGLHTIARDSKFAGGSLSQTELDQLASKLDYKEVNSFYKGTLKSASISLPIQNKVQLQQAIDWLSKVKGVINKDWPQSVINSLVILEKVRA